MLDFLFDLCIINSHHRVTPNFFVFLFILLFVHVIYLFDYLSINNCICHYLSINNCIYHYLSLYLSPNPTITHYIYISLYLSITPSMYHSIYVSLHLCITPSMYHSFYVSLHLCFYHSIYVSLYLLLYLSLYLSLYLLSMKEKEAVIAPWFHLRLPSCGPGFESQANHLHFLQFIL